MNLFDALLSFQLTLLLHATLLLGAVWALERGGALRHPGWAELAWRAALLAALVSATLSVGAGHAPAALDAARPVPAATHLAPAEQSPKTGLEATLPVIAPVAAETPTPASSAQGPLASTPSPIGAEAPPTGRPIAIAEWLAWALLAPWLLGVAVSALRLGGQWLRVRRWQRRISQGGADAAPALQALARQLAGELGLPAAPPLRVDPSLASPLLLPDGHVLLPEWVATLSSEQQRALLAHELAHLARRDPAWRLAQRLLALPLFFHPLARHALHRLESLAEDACDARAAQLCGTGRPLAESLAVCLAHHTADPARSSALAVAMAETPGPVVRRVTRLLENRPMPASLPPALRRTALAGALLAALALPGLAITSVASPAWAGDLLGSLFSGASHTQFNGKDHYVHRNARTGERIEMTLRGDVRFTDAEDDIAGLAPNGLFELSVRRGGVERSLRVVPGPQGLQRTFEIDGEAKPFDAEARAWLASALPELLRETALQAEARGKRILERGGSDALLAEIDLIRADHARGRYLGVLFTHAQLDETRLTRALDIASRIGSDFELRRALEAGLSNQAMSPAAQARLLGTAATIGSDFELAQLLLPFAETGSLQEPVLAAWREALAGIGSDFEQRRVLLALLARGEPAATRIALENAAGIGSDFEARSVLEAAVDQVRADTGVRAAWFEVFGGVGSDFEQRQALQALIEEGPVDIALANEVLAALASVGSDHESLQVMRALAAVMPADAALIERYRAASRRLSDHERGQAERALDHFTMAAVD